MCMEAFTLCMENFVRIRTCLLHSDFGYCLEKSCKNSLQHSSSYAKKISHASCKNLSGNLKKHIKLPNKLD